MVTEATRARASIAFDAGRLVVIEAMERGCALGTAARLAGLSPGLVHRWLLDGESDPDGKFGAFTVRVRQLQGQHIEAAEKLHAAHREANPAACQWYMARIAPDTYGDAPQTVVVREPERLPDATPDEVAQAIKGGR